MSGIGPLALYAHIPFCETKCPYCDFNTFAGIDGLMPSYVAALRRELAAWGDVLAHPEVETVFFGGGTPSYLPAEDMSSVVETIRSTFHVAPAAEVTLEANPGDLTAAKLAAYLECGVNRLSIGVQSLSDRLLDVLGRRHSTDDAVDAYQMAMASGFNNVSIDLMYGLPYQTMDDWEETLVGAVRLSPPHISMYCLTLEAGTPLEQQVKSGQMPEPDSDLAADMYLAAQDALGQRGYRQYEISNWSQPGFESRHNMTYWRNQPFLGVGPGAHSYLPGFRFFNLKSPREYIRRVPPEFSSQVDRPWVISREAIEGMPAVDGVEAIDRPLEMADTLMMGLRLDTGVSTVEFTRRFGVTLSHAYDGAIDELTSVNLVETVDGWVRLTPRGRLLGNEVFSRFLSGRR